MNQRRTGQTLTKRERKKKKQKPTATKINEKYRTPIQKDIQAKAAFVKIASFQPGR